MGVAAPPDKGCAALAIAGALSYHAPAESFGGKHDHHF